MPKIPKVILLIETSHSYGRQLLRGIAKYSALHGPWTFYRQPPFYIQPHGKKLKLSQLPEEGSDPNSDLEDEFSSSNLIEEVKTTVDKSGILTYYTKFQKEWEGSLKGYFVETKVVTKNGDVDSDGSWISVKNANEILVLSKIVLSYVLPIITKTSLNCNRNCNHLGIFLRETSRFSPY